MMAFLVGLGKGMAKVAIDGEKELFDIPLRALPRNIAVGADFDLTPPSGGGTKASAKPAAVPAEAGGPKSNSAHDRQQYALRRLVGHGWTPEQASGVVGRFMQEAFPRLDTKARGDLEIPGASVGIGQWNRGRKAALLGFAKRAGKSPDDFDAQLDFFDWEIRNSPSERRAFEALSAAKTPEEASAAMMSYERPQGWTPNNPRGGHGFSATVRNAGRVLQGFDPNYTPSVEVAGGEGPAPQSGGHRKKPSAAAGLVNSILTDMGLDPLEDFDSEAFESEEGGFEDFGNEANVLAFGESGETAPDDSGERSEARREATLAMILAGQQASMQAEGFPTFADLFGGAET